MTTDEEIRGRIEQLVSEEHRLWEAESRGEATETERRRLGELKLALDQCSGPPPAAPRTRGVRPRRRHGARAAHGGGRELRAVATSGRGSRLQSARRAASPRLNRDGPESDTAFMPEPVLSCPAPGQTAPWALAATAIGAITSFVGWLGCNEDAATRRPAVCDISGSARGLLMLIGAPVVLIVAASVLGLRTFRAVAALTVLAEAVFFIVTLQGLS